MLQAAAYRLLACFETTNERSFVDLCTAAGYPTDLGGYYLRQLVRSDYLDRGERGVYVLTPKGRAQMAVAQDKHQFVNRPRLITLVVAKYADKFVVLRRGRQPFIGVAEWPARAVKLGEPLHVAAAHLATDRLTVMADPRLVGFFRRIDLYDGELFDDKLFAVHTLDLESKPERLNVSTGELELHYVGAMPQITKPARSLLDILNYVNQPSAPYVEQVYHLTAVDFEPNVTS
jgi:hypothetical protein